MRRPAVALTSLAAIAALAFSPATATQEEGTHLDLTAAATGTSVAGTLDFGGALTTGSDDAGDATVPGAGLDVGDLRLAQDGPNFVVELDVLDAFQGNVAPTALYKVDVTSTLSLMAYRGPGVWDYQVADFSDGYSSGDAQGEFDGSTITWTVPASTFGGPATQLAPSYLSTQGISPAGLLSLQLSGFVEIDAASPLAVFTTGGRIDVTVTDADGTEVDSTVAFAPNGTWAYDAGDLAPGTYTVSATSTYGDLTETATVAVVVPEPEEPVAQ